MQVFHPQIQISIPSPISSWAKEHAELVATWPKTLRTISDSRTKQIDFQRLGESIESAMGLSCQAIEWVNEGGAHQIYLVHLNDGSQLLARLSFTFPHEVHTGAEFAYQEEHDRLRIPHRLESEVATMRYLKKHTKIPVATVFFLDSDLSNLVGTPYTLQEKLCDHILADVWLKMTPEQQFKLVGNLAGLWCELYSLRFNAYGSLNGSGTVGRLVEPTSCLHRDHVLRDSGPWSPSSPFSLLLALVTREFDWLSSHSGRLLFETWRTKMHPKEQLSLTFPAFMELSESLLELVPKLNSLFPLPQEAFRPTLWHGDLHISNMLVSSSDSTQITGIIDWEFSAILPLWDAMQYPERAEDKGDRLETDVAWREHKKQLRIIYREVVCKAFPEANYVFCADTYQPAVIGLRTFKVLATRGVALYYSCERVVELLKNVRKYAATDEIASIAILEHLIELFSALVP